MTNPKKVIGFLDITGAWDPSLAFVMGGAVISLAILYRLIFAKNKPIFASSFDVPTKLQIDLRLVIGSAIFGVGWGLSGVCPGPGVANLFSGNIEFLLFVVPMFAGFFLGKKI